MIRRDATIVRLGHGRRPLTVVRIRRTCPLTRRIAQRMRSAGWPSDWISSALGLSARRVEDLLAVEAIWREPLRETAP